MSDKHLTEAPWKALATKQKIKDPGLGKALLAYGKAPEDDYDARLEALEEVEEHTDDLLKEHKKNKDVADYLDDISSELAKKRKELEKLAEEQEGGEDEEEGGGTDPASIKKKIVSALQQVKSKGAESEFKFIACLGKAESSVMIGKKAGNSQKKALLAMLPGVSSPKFVRGACIFEENAFTFVLEAVPGGLARKLRQALFLETEQKFRVRVRSVDGATVSDSETEPEEGESEGETSTAPPPPPPPPTTPPGEAAPGQAEFMTRLKAIKPDLDRVIAGQVAVSSAAATLLGLVATQAKARDFATALPSMEKLEALVEAGLQQLSVASGESVDAAGDFKKRLAELLPKIKEAITSQSPAAADLRLRASEAGAYGKQANYVQANAVLDQIEILLGAKPSTVSPLPSSDEGKESEAEGKPETPEALYEAQFAELEPGYLEASKAGALNKEAEGLVSRLKTIWAYATQQADAGNHAKALDAFKRIKAEGLFAAIGKAKGGGTGISGDIVAKRQFLVTRWQQIPPALNAELNSLKAAIAKSLPDEEASEMTDAMSDHLGTLVEEIQDEIDAAINAGDMSKLKGLRGRITGDALVQHLLGNPFISGSKFQSLMLDALDEVEQKLAA